MIQLVDLRLLDLKHNNNRANKCVLRIIHEDTCCAAAANNEHACALVGKELVRPYVWKCANYVREPM